MQAAGRSAWRRRVEGIRWHLRPRGVQTAHRAAGADAHHEEVGVGEVPSRNHALDPRGVLRADDG